jgi:hypothetical protein
MCNLVRLAVIPHARTRTHYYSSKRLLSRPGLISQTTSLEAEKAKLREEWRVTYEDEVLHELYASALVNNPREELVET